MTTLNEIHQKLEELLKNENWGDVKNDFQELNREFQSLMDTQPVKVNEEGIAEGELDEILVEKTKELLKIGREKNEEYRKNKTESEKKNLTEKKSILAEMMRVISEEEHIGKAYQTFNELKDKWRNLGNVPYAKHHEIQQEFSRLSELFYYNMNIYKELRENDLKKNLEIKEEIIKRLETLAEKVSDLKGLKTTMRQIQKEWDEVGATFKENWEELRNRYWEAIKKIQGIIEQEAGKKKEKQLEFLEAKKALIEKTKAILDREFQRNKDWDKATEEIIAIQQEWKGLGFAPKAENEKVWKEFRNLCDDFFNKKKEFFSGLKGEWDQNKEKKQAIINKALELANSTEWKETANQLIRLQKDWQKIGSAGQKSEHALWMKFREACDKFFNRKKEFFAAQDLALDENLKKKEAFIASLPERKIEGSEEEKIQTLNEISKEFSSLGEIPGKDRGRIQKAFRDALDHLSSSMNIDPKTREMAVFKAQIETLKSDSGNADQLQRERNFIREKINRINDEIVKIENNLGFFNTKGNNAFLKQYQDQIDSKKKEIEALKEKLKLIPKA